MKTFYLILLLETFEDSEIFTSVTILRLIDIDDSELTFTLLFRIRLEWYDDDVKFLFLKDLMKENIVNEEIQTSIWNPEIKVLVAVPGSQNIISEYFSVRKEGKPKLSNDNDHYTMNETYDGDQNSFVKEFFIQSKFVCTFDKIETYPFGVQTCGFGISLKDPADEFRIKMRKGNISHDPREFKNKGDGTYKIGQYMVNSWEIYLVSFGSKDKMIVDFYMTRSLFTVFMVTYLPTVLMNVMNQAVVYIRMENKFELIISVNITCMMVLASMYLSVSSSLPSTANIKPIETWLLVNLMYPVLVIISNVIVQNVQEATNNGVVAMGGPGEMNRKHKYIQWIAYYLIPSLYVLFVLCYAAVYWE